MSNGSFLLLFAVIVAIHGNSCRRAAAACPQQSAEPSLLPFTTSDLVVRRDPGTGQLSRTSGVIEGLSGDSLQLRRSGLRTDHIRLRDIVELQFRKSPDHERGLRLFAEGEYAAAVSSFEAARMTEPRAWVVCELHGSAAHALLALRRYPEAIQQVEAALKLDPKTRHVAFLPLVWDHQLPEYERFPATAQQLTAGTGLSRFVAATALLHDLRHQAQAIDVLTQQTRSGQPWLQQLAETQLWRLKLFDPDRLREADTSFWKMRVAELHREVRGGAEYVLGRALLMQHDADGAAISLMWMPLMAAYDPPVAAASLLHAAVALRRVGRLADSDRTLQELERRFPKTSSALKAHLPEQPLNAPND